MNNNTALKNVIAQVHVYVCACLCVRQGMEEARHSLNTLSVT